MYYPCSENKSADQLRSYPKADLRLCSRLCRLLVFPWGGSYVNFQDNCSTTNIPAFPVNWRTFFDWEATMIFVGWFMFQAFLYILPVGRVVAGQPTIIGNHARLPYRCNGLYLVMYYMSRDARKLDNCLCENKGADQLRGNREADQRLCFRYSDSTIPPLLNSKISSF